MNWKRLRACITGCVDRELLLCNEYLATENRILRNHLKGRLCLTDDERIRLAEIGKRLGRKALEEVAQIVRPETILAYQELRRLAAFKMANESPGQTLQPTALVHEAWLRLVGKDGEAQFKNRAHFFGAAAEAMRRILIDNARRKLAAEAKDDELLALNDAPEKFAAQDKPKAELVTLRYFVGLTIEEAAEIPGISEPTAKRHWACARARLHAEIKSCSL